MLRRDPQRLILLVKGKQYAAARQVLDEHDQTLWVSPERLRQLRQINDAGDPVEWLTTAGSTVPRERR